MAEPSNGPRSRRAASEEREAQYDLLTAALIGAAVGATATLLLRRGPGGRRPIAPMADGVLRGAKWAARAARVAGTAGGRELRKAAVRGAEAIEDIPFDALEAAARERLGRAQRKMDAMMAREMRALRKAVRRQTARFGA